MCKQPRKYSMCSYIVEYCILNDLHNLPCKNDLEKMASSYELFYKWDSDNQVPQNAMSGGLHCLSDIL